MPGNDAFTKLLLHGDGTNGSTSIIDSSASAHTVTRAGDVQISTAQSEFGGAAIKFDGTGDYLQLDGSSDFAFGTGDFTIDFWLYVVAYNLGTASNFAPLYDSRDSAASTLAPTILVESDNLKYFTNGSARITMSGRPSTGSWHHIAVARENTSTKMFVDGTQVGSTYTDSNNYITQAARPVIGAVGDSPTFEPLNGYIDELRVSKGVARWNANFTPPTLPYSGNVVLTAGTGSFGVSGKDISMYIPHFYRLKAETGVFASRGSWHSVHNDFDVKRKRNKWWAKLLNG